MMTLMVWRANFFQRVKFLLGCTGGGEWGPRALGNRSIIAKILKIVIRYTKLTLLSN